MYAEELTDASSVRLTAPARDAPELSHRVQRSHSPRQPIALLGVAFDNLTLRETVNRIEEMIASPRSHYVVTANMDFLAVARRDPEFQRILLNAHLVLCDGTPLVWASRLFGNPLPERVAGADVVPELIRVAAEKHYRLFFLGATEESNTQAIARLRARFPDLDISHYSPPFRPLPELDNADIIRRVRAAKPDLLFVAFGCPKAEKWMARHYAELGVPVAIGIGATIDFLAGRVKRAPLWMQRGGVEWIYRLCQEPRRLFKRYATDLWFFGRTMARQCRTMKLRSGGGQPQTRTAVIQSNGTWQRVQAANCLHRDCIERDTAQWKRIAGADRHCLLELAEVKSMDSTGVAVLVHLQKQLHLSGRQLILLSPSAAVRRALKAMRLENFFEVATDALEARAVLETRLHERDASTGDDSGSLLVWLGEIPAINAEQIWQCTQAAIHRHHATAESWTLDLAAVRFMDSDGVKLLLRAVEIARAHGICLRFSHPSLRVRNVLRGSNHEYLLDHSA
ncbi:MAG: WecB/TagA/CpsF family glycosyltransferase [Verrucomicrobia bacterium]|nr:WecB/TagA/CpsF family glycosyltransferase [Verrucomicrobiota bacterium]